jgi:hypothetical protein
MEPNSITRQDFEKAVGDLREEFDAKLEKVLDRVLTAVFGFVNGASARMEWLEGVETSVRKDVVGLERRLQACERSGRRPSAKKAR